MEEKEVKAPSSEKLSYEELENVAHQLSEQNRQLYAKLQEVNISNMFKRLDYLFKVVENASMFDLEFCTDLARDVKVGAVPGSSFFKDNVQNYMRLHFAKSEETLKEALHNLSFIREKIKPRK